MSIPTIMHAPSPVHLLAMTAAAGLLIVVLVRRLLPGARVSAAWLRRRSERERPTDIESAALYHRWLPTAERTDALDERTWRDLDLDDVFRCVDHTVSEPGRQYLYHIMRMPRLDAEPLRRLERVVDELADAPGAVRQLREALGGLTDPRGGQLARLVLGELPPRPAVWWIFPLLTVGALACLALITVWPRAFIVWLAIAVVNVGVQLYYKGRVRRVVPAMHELPALVAVAHALGAQELRTANEEVETLRSGALRLRMLRRATRWLMFEPGQTSELAASAYEYVNLLFLLDVNAFVFAIDSVRTLKPVLRAVFDAVGYLDAAQSVVTWRATLGRWAVPEFTGATKGLGAQEIVHPLLDSPVPNDLEIEETGVLVTGSNMSGKTTFIRTLGVNAILAQTLHTVCGSSWRAPLLRVRSSIGRGDSIQEGRSYYLAEAESVRALVEAKRDDVQHLFVLDEIFRGTNTTERVATAYAVLSHLNRGADLVLVATHDIELVELLGGSYAVHHFREQVDGGSLSFDYRLRPGPSSSRNAIALLRVLDYPEELVADALAALDWPARVGLRSGSRI